MVRRTQVAGLAGRAAEELVGVAQREEIVAEALDERFVADEDAGFDVFGTDVLNLEILKREVIYILVHSCMKYKRK